jgi:CBS domain-containing protein
MTRDVVTVNRHSSVKDIVRQFAETWVTAAPVADALGRPPGSERARLSGGVGRQ